MNILYFQYIAAIADCGSISKAAQKLLLRQQYLSYVVKTLESEFSIQIFQRHSKGVTLTEDGQVFLDAAKQILTIYDNMHLQYQYPSKEIAKIGNTDLLIYFPSLLFPYQINKTIAEYLNLFPNMNVQMQEDDCRDIRALGQKLLQEDLAIGFYATRKTFDEFASQLPPELACISLGQGKIAMLTAKEAFDKAPLKEISLQDLCQKDLLFCAPTGLDNNPTYQILAQYGRPKVASVVKNATTFLTILESKSYCALGSARITEHNPKIAAVPISDYVRNPLAIAAITRKDRLSSPLVRDFINLLLMQLNEHTI